MDGLKNIYEIYKRFCEHQTENSTCDNCPANDICDNSLYEKALEELKELSINN